MQIACLLVVLGTISRAQAADVSPVEKVVTMLEDLQLQVINEGKAEAKTYDKFACFCKDMSEEKSAEITAGTDAESDLNGKIDALVSDRSGLDDDISDLTTKISGLSKTLADTAAQRHKENTLYLSLHEEISTGLRNLLGAVKELKAKMSAVALAQLKSAVTTASSLGLMSPSRHKVLGSLLEAKSKAPEEYAFASGDILQTVEDIGDDFKSTKSDLESDEEESRTTYETLKETKEKEKADAERSLGKKQERTAKKSELIATTSSDLTSTKAVLTDDQSYIKDLTAKCEAKSKEWDQRSKMRQDELTAISTAITIVSGKVADKTSDKTMRLVQMPQRMPISQLVVEDKVADEVDDIMSAEATSFLQLRDPRKAIKSLATLGEKVDRNLRANGNDNQQVRERLITLLKSRSSELGSTTLSMLASRVAGDPFVKIKKLIQELVERLLQEAADEANHKGWCDKETGKAKQQRASKAANVKALNQEMSDNEAKRDKLTEDISILGQELTELQDSLAKLTKERQEESAENTATVSEAEEGKAAVEQAIDVLTKFYKTAAKAAAFVELKTTHKGVDDDMPDTGFKGSNKGSQGAASGILGMLEVIQSDFERTMVETEKDEKSAMKNFMEFETTSKVSIGTKTVGKTTKEQELTETNDALLEQKDNLIAEQDLMEKAIQELQELQPACVQTAMSYEERVAKREHEIESLKEGLCVLGMQGPVQTEQGCDEK